ncbi:MAG: FAD-dependent oxidoreductase [Actinomycetes bacterium]
MHGSISATLPAGPPTYDVIVVGARVAGSATAMLLARAGLRVLVLDAARRGSDMVSTHAFMRGGVVQLHRWGLLDRVVASGTPAVRRTVFHYGDQQVPVGLKPVGGTDGLYAPKRTVLDPLLAAAAEESGAEMRFGVRVDALTRDGTGRVTGVRGRDRAGRPVEARARVVVGADGVRSLVARAVDAPVLARGSGAGAGMLAYVEGVHADGFQWLYGTDGEGRRAG